MKSTIAIAAFVLLIPAFAAAQHKGYPKPQVASAAAKPAPDFTLKDQDGKDFQLSSQRGHWVLLYFYRGYW